MHFYQIRPFFTILEYPKCCKIHHSSIGGLVFRQRRINLFLCFVCKEEAGTYMTMPMDVDNNGRTDRFFQANIIIDLPMMGLKLVLSTKF